MYQEPLALYNLLQGLQRFIVLEELRWMYCNGNLSNWSSCAGSGNPATAHMTTGQKLASVIPGTDANKEKKMYEGRY